MNSVKTTFVLLEFSSSCFWEVMGSIPVGDSDFSLSHARVMLINSPFRILGLLNRREVNIAGSWPNSLLQKTTEQDRTSLIIKGLFNGSRENCLRGNSG